MTPNLAVDALRAIYWVIIQLVGAAVLPAMAVGLVVGMLQAKSPTGGSTMSIVPKLVVTIATLVGLGAMMLRVLSDRTLDVWDLIPALLE